MKSMPYQLKQKLRQYDKAIRKAKVLHEELSKELVNIMCHMII